jgi:hypothetical protein
MTSTELRIGNYVWDDYSGEMIVSAILESSAIYLRKTIALPSGEYLIKNIEPIPLTEEWLLKFGFDNINSREYGIKCGSCWMSLNNPKDMGEWQDYYCWTYDRFKFIELKYVHQLQNLYFALTGNELEIK